MREIQKCTQFLPVLWFKETYRDTRPGLFCIGGSVEGRMLFNESLRPMVGFADLTVCQARVSGLAFKHSQDSPGPYFT